MTSIDEPRLQRLPQVCARIGVSKSAIYRWVQEGKFPPPFRIGDNTSAWDGRAIDRWISARIATSSKEVRNVLR